jgi:formyltetrahydrofolate synthetase
MLSIFKTKKEENQANTIQDYLDFIQTQVEQKKYVRQGGGTVGFTNPHLEIQTKNKEYNFLVFFKDEKHETSTDRLIIQHRYGHADIELSEQQETQFKKIIQIYKNLLIKKINEYEEEKKTWTRDFISKCLTKGLV